MPTPGWQNSTRRNTLPKDWHKRRSIVKKRDGYVCVLCGAPGTDVDHIDRNGGDGVDNLRLLCKTCHQKKSSEEGGQAYAAKRQAVNKRLRRTEAHPGLL